MVPVWLLLVLNITHFIYLGNKLPYFKLTSFIVPKADENWKAICDPIRKNLEQSRIFNNLEFCITVFYIPKAFCSSIKSILQIVWSYKAKLWGKQCNHLYAFLRWLKLHKFDYTIITYRYFSLRSWNKDHHPLIYNFIPKHKS